VEINRLLEGGTIKPIVNNSQLVRYQMQSFFENNASSMQMTVHKSASIVGETVIRSRLEEIHGLLPMNIPPINYYTY
jgi:hypothetical protein